MPDKLKEMQDLFYAEAKKYDVLPLDNSTLARWNTPRPSPTAGRTVFTYSGELSGVPPSAAPEHPGQVLHHHGRGRDSRRRRGRDDRYRGRALRRLRPVPEQGRVRHRPGQGGVPLQPARPEAHGVGRAGTRAPASTPSSSTSSPTVPASARAARACSRWMARKWPGTRWRTRRRSRSRRTRPSTSAWTRAPPLALIEYRYDVPFKFTGKIDKLTFKLEPEPATKVKQ